MGDKVDREALHDPRWQSNWTEYEAVHAEAKLCGQI